MSLWFPDDVVSLARPLPEPGVVSKFLKRADNQLSVFGLSGYVMTEAIDVAGVLKAFRLVLPVELTREGSWHGA